MYCTTGLDFSISRGVCLFGAMVPFLMGTLFTQDLLEILMLKRNMQSCLAFLS